MILKTAVFRTFLGKLKEMFRISGLPHAYMGSAILSCCLFWTTKSISITASDSPKCCPKEMYQNKNWPIEFRHANFVWSSKIGEEWSCDGQQLSATANDVRLSYKHCTLTKDLLMLTIVNNHLLLANGRKSILVNRTTSCCKSEDLQANIGDQKWLPTATIWWWLLKPFLWHSQTHRQVNKDNLRLLPT